VGQQRSPVEEGTDFTYTDNIFEVRGDFGILDWSMPPSATHSIFRTMTIRTAAMASAPPRQTEPTRRPAARSDPYLGRPSYYRLFNDSTIPDFHDRNIVTAMRVLE
jgi:hypothetical protein